MIPTDESTSPENDYSQDMLFSDGSPSADPKVGYRGISAAAAAGISYRQLDYWDRTGLVQPSVRDIRITGGRLE